MCIEKTPPDMEKKICYCSNGDFISCRNWWFVHFVFQSRGKSLILHLIFSNTMCLKIDENGRAVFIGSGAAVRSAVWCISVYCERWCGKYSGLKTMCVLLHMSRRKMIRCISLWRLTETEMKRYLIIMWQMWLMVHGCRKTGEKIISWK